MGPPEWLQLLDNTFVGEANGFIKAELSAKWGEGTSGSQLMATLGNKIEGVISYLREFGDISPKVFEAALITELGSAAPGSTTLLLKLTSCKSQCFRPLSKVLFAYFDLCQLRLSHIQCLFQIWQILLSRST